MNKDNPSWGAILNLASQIRICDESGLITPSLAMCFIAIDSLASLARPIDKARVTRSDFVDWVNRYLNGHSEQKYKYSGKDVYAARCSFLHTYGATSEIHERDTTTIKFVYHDGGRHVYRPEVNPALVIIGVRSFADDVIRAMDDFVEECDKDIELRARVEARLNELFNIVPIQ